MICRFARLRKRIKCSAHQLNTLILKLYLNSNQTGTAQFKRGFSLLQPDEFEVLEALQKSSRSRRKWPKSKG
jgi:hypothetical protein